MFINKTLHLNNLKTRTAMNAKISVLLFVLKPSYICYYIICTSVPLRHWLRTRFVKKKLKKFYQHDAEKKKKGSKACKTPLKFLAIKLVYHVRTF